MRENKFGYIYFSATLQSDTDTDAKKKLNNHFHIPTLIHGAPRRRTGRACTGINETSEASLPAIYAVVAGPVEYLPCRSASRTERKQSSLPLPIIYRCSHSAVLLTLYCSRSSRIMSSVARLVIHCHWHGLLARFALICLCPSRPVGLICPLVPRRWGRSCVPASACEL